MKKVLLMAALFSAMFMNGYSQKYDHYEDMKKAIPQKDIDKAKEYNMDIYFAILDLKNVLTENDKILNYSFGKNPLLKEPKLDRINALIDQQGGKNKSFFNSLCYQCLVDIYKKQLEIYYKYDHKANVLSAKAESGLKAKVDSFVAFSKRKYTFEKLVKDENKSVNETAYKYTYANRTEKEPLPFYFTILKTMEGANRDMEIEGTPFFRLTTATSTSFLDIFPFWQKFINPDANMETIQEKKVDKVILNINNRLYEYTLIRYGNSSEWEIFSSPGNKIKM